VSEHNIALIRQAIKQPYGIILISGPTGSGKSTTLYAMLSEVDRIGMNVISLEDPVEYNIDGVSQSQVRPEIGYTFANGLRTALRQDPDVIMVGEIRDKETAQLAIQAALTGHLVLSTIHTNNSTGVVPRLIDMGVDPYLIAPTLELALAQRLVRRICPNSGKKMPLVGGLKAMIDDEFKDLPDEFRNLIPKTDHVLFAEPTAECSNGTKGRVAVMEALTINEEIEKLILNGADEETLLKAARTNGFISMKEDAIIKALNHDIPFEEISTLGGAMLVSDEAEKEAETIKEEVVKETSVDNQGIISV
jgi:type IV pilus assembly protein PilB